MKLRRKLFASALAVAACAATLTTSTYAWYTTNANVSASGISAGSASTGDSSIFISDDNSTWKQNLGLSKTYNKYYTNASWTTYQTSKDVGDLAECTTEHEHGGANCHESTQFVTMVPVQLMQNGSFKDLSGAAASGDATFSFILYFKTAKTSENVDLYLKSYTLQNKVTATANLPVTDNLLNDDGTADVGVDRSKATYAVDICNCLGMVTKTTADAFDLAAGSGSAEAVTNNFDLTTSWDNANSVGTKIVASSNVNSGKALAYYNEVMGKSEAKGANVQALTTPKFADGSRTKVAVLDKDGGSCAIQFTIFLNGWDDFCYDACKGQEFYLDLSFTTENTQLLNN